MKKTIGLLFALAFILCVASKLYAHSLNGVDSTTSGKVIKFGSLTLTSGSGTASFASGTATAGLFFLNHTDGAGTTTTFKAELNGPDVTFYAYDGVGATSTANFTGTYLIGK